MKTLEEVIRALEICTSDYGGCEKCPYDPDCKPDNKWDDALHYLKEYRDMKNTLDVERKETIEAYRQWQDAKEKLEAQTNQIMWVDNHFQFEISDNLPLTWDELRTIEGKPIWVEDNNGWYKGWVVIEKFVDDDMFTTGFTYEKNNLGTIWQAYRKER